MLPYFQRLSSVIFLCIIAKNNGQSVYVNTSRGQVVGYHIDLGSNTSALYYGQGDVFLGIPYAQPPVGLLRYKPPQRLNTFPTIPYNASSWGSQCPQSSGGSEDCLFLNIYTPNAISSVKYPVMVFIHGGGLMVSSNRIPTDGTIRNLVSRGVVVASIQYRLGFLGFFTTFTDDFPPNLGMLDQVEALKFIQEEISNFGGDPSQVTIFGQSAGAASVSAHTYSPLSQNLFNQAIQESGAVMTCFEGGLGLTNQNFEFAHRACGYTVQMWNSGNYNPLKDCLYNMNVSDALKYNYGYAGNAACWNMVQDNNFFPDVPKNLAKKRTEKPMMIGSNRDEFWAFILAHTNISNFTKENSEDYLASKFANFFGSQTQQIIEVLENLYLEPSTTIDDHLAWVKMLDYICTAFFFTGGAAIDVELHLSNNNSNVFVYQFTYANRVAENTGYYPVVHGAELTYVFMGGWNYETDKNQTDVELADFFGEAWTNFAKNGKPTTDDSWKPVTTTDLLGMEYLDINPNRGMKAGYRALDRIQFTRIMPVFVGPLPPAIPDYNNGSRIGCPEGWAVSSTNSKKCYNIFHFSPLSQTDAQRNCEQYFGSLLSIDNAFEDAAITGINRFLSQLFSSLGFIKSNAPTCTTSYIGLMRHGTTWKWMNSDNSTYLNWEAGNPSTDSSATCAVINSNDGKWSNQACAIPQCYLCSFDF